MGRKHLIRRTVHFEFKGSLQSDRDETMLHSVQLCGYVNHNSLDGVAHISIQKTLTLTVTDHVQGSLVKR